MSYRHLSKRKFIMAQDAIVQEIIAMLFETEWLNRSPEQVQALKRSLGCDVCPNIPQARAIALRELEMTRDTIEDEYTSFAKR